MSHAPRAEADEGLVLVARVDGGWILLGEFTPTRGVRAPTGLAGRRCGQFTPLRGVRASAEVPLRSLGDHAWVESQPLALPRLPRLPSSILPQSWNLTALASASGGQPSSPSLAEISPGCARLAEWHMWFHRLTDGSI